MKDKEKKAFTLIELLVVVAIIGILASVGVVAYNGYTASAKEQVCKQNFNLLSKMIKEKYTMCEFNNTIKLQAQYSKNGPGAESNFNCIAYGSSIGTVSNAVLKHFTNFAKDPYNDFDYNIGVFTWNGTPYYDGMISLYGSTIKTRCRGKQYAETIQP